MTGESDVANPVDVEQNLRRIANDIGKGVRGVSEALRDYRTKERVFDLAYAQAFAAYEGAANMKRYVADEAAMGERKARDDAEVVFKYAERRARALESELSAWQTIGRSVLAMYGAAGVSGGG